MYCPKMTCPVWSPLPLQPITENVLGEQHLFRMMKAYIEYHNQYRPHQGLDQRIPAPVKTFLPSTRLGLIKEQPILGGLHHHYSQVAA